MKYYVLFAAALALHGQSSVTVYTKDINGNVIAGDTSHAGDGTHTQTTRSLNGRTVPTEQSDERVISETPTSRVTERIVKKFDQQGNLTQTERFVTETEKRPAGSTVNTTVYRTDLSGNTREEERRTVETNSRGNATDTQTTIARQTMNGFETVEKRSAVAETTDNGTHIDETVYHPSNSGGFVPTTRTVSDSTKNGDETVTKAAFYEPLSDATRMELSRQTVTTLTARPDGSSVERVDYYGRSTPEEVSSPTAPQQLLEQDTIQRSAPSNGQVTETLTARRTSHNDPGKLGPPIKVSETVCTGKCSGQ